MKDAEYQEGGGNRPLFFSSLVVRRLVMRDTFRSNDAPTTPPRSATPFHDRSNAWKVAAVAAIEKHMDDEKKDDSSEVFRAKTDAVIVHFSTFVCKVFRPDSKQYEEEKNGYQQVQSLCLKQKIIPEVEFFEGFGPDNKYFAIKMEELRPLELLNKNENELSELKNQLTQMLQQLWDRGYKHGDVVRRRCGEEVIAWDNFMRDSLENLVLIDLEQMNTKPNQDLANEERTSWAYATFR